MEDEITTIYCLCEDLLKAMNIDKDPQVRMGDAEVITTALTASIFFSGNYERSREFYPNMDTWKGRHNAWDGGRI